MPQQLQWTMGEAPDLDEAADQAAPDPLRPEPPRRSNRRIWPLTMALIAAALVGLGAFTLWNSQQASRDLRRVIAAEETAGSAGDKDTLADIADPADPAWRETLLQLAAAHQPAPLPYAGLRPLPNWQEVVALTHLAPDAVRADVTRGYLAPDGTTLAFTLPQFYRFTEKEWHRVAPPAEEMTNSFWRGHALMIVDHTADANFVDNDLGPYLDDLVQRACEVWTCPRGPFIGVNFADDFSFASGTGLSPAPAGTPLLFGFIRGANPTPIPTVPNFLATAVNLQSPHMAGYPANSATTAWLRRAIALQTLGALANHVAGIDSADQHDNAFVLALVVRMGARLGLEAPSALDWTSAAGFGQPADSTLATNLNLMWNLSQPDGHGPRVLGFREADGTKFGPDDPSAWDAVLNGALAITNRMLSDQPPAMDGQLLRALSVAHDQTQWLAGGLGLSADEAWTRLQVARWQTSRPAGQPAWALNCNYGVGLLAAGQSQPVYIVPWQTDTFGQAQEASYSPDGQWLIGDDSSGLMAVNLETGRFVRVPAPPTQSSLALRGWLTNSIIAYVVQVGGSPYQSSVNFFDLDHPESSPPSLPGLQDYLLSPDKTQAAVIVTPEKPVPGLANLGRLAVIPARGGPPTVLGDAVGFGLVESLVAWAPDSRQLAYAHLEAASDVLSLRVADLTAGTRRKVLNNQEIGLNSRVDGLVAWSPSGRQIAFALRMPEQSGQLPAALGIANADGSGLTLLRSPLGAFTQLGWSADGRYLAATNYESPSQGPQAATVIILNANSKLVSRELVNSWAFAWSPHGHQLVSIHDPVQLYAEPTSTTPQVLSTDACYTAAWMPLS